MATEYLHLYWYTMSEFDLASCEPTTSILLGCVGLVALVVLFFGYRLYNMALGLLAFVVGAAAAFAIGSSWIAQNSSTSKELLAKKLIVVVFCILWGAMSAWICVRIAVKLNQVLGFILGAFLAAAAISGILELTQHILETQDVETTRFQGWEQYALFILGVPLAILVGYLSRNSVKYFVMFASALLGAAVAIDCLAMILACAQVDMEVIGMPPVLLVATVAMTVLGAVVQLFTQPREAEESKLPELEVLPPADRV